MKTAVVHSNAKPVEKDWSKQFAGLDPDVKSQFASTVDWSVRTAQVFTIPGTSWNDVVATVSNAASAAGAGGVVIIASGHGGVVPNDLRAGIINWDASDGDVTRVWEDGKFGKGIFWDEVIAQYTDEISPFSRPKTRKEEDELKVNNKSPGAKMAKLRLDAFDALQKIGKALQDQKVRRLTFTVCTAGAATQFMDKLAKHLHTQVACFKITTAVLDDHTFGHTPGKARLILERDRSADNKGTNTMGARVFSPSLDDTSIAYVANP